MQINKTTIKVQCSYDFQVASMEAEIEDYTDEELDSYIQYLVDKCSETVKKTSAKVGPAHQQNKTPVGTNHTNQALPTSRVMPQGTQGYAKINRYQQPNQPNQIRMASEKQLDYLKNAFRYIPSGPITFDEANRLLKEFRSQQ